MNLYTFNIKKYMKIYHFYPNHLYLHFFFVGYRNNNQTPEYLSMASSLEDFK